VRRTTVRIEDELLADAKAFAARHGRSLNSVVEDALRQMLNRADKAAEQPRAELPVYGEEGGQPLIDMSPEGLKEFLDKEDTAHFLEVYRRDAARRERADQRPPTGG
jgi:plasmid stability protein